MLFGSHLIQFLLQDIFSNLEQSISYVLFVSSVSIIIIILLKTLQKPPEDKKYKHEPLVTINLHSHTCFIYYATFFLSLPRDSLLILSEADGS